MDTFSLIVAIGIALLYVTMLVIIMTFVAKLRALSLKIIGHLSKLWVHVCTEKPSCHTLGTQDMK